MIEDSSDDHLLRIEDDIFTEDTPEEQLLEQKDAPEAPNVTAEEKEPLEDPPPTRKRLTSEDYTTEKRKADAEPIVRASSRPRLLEEDKETVEYSICGPYLEEHGKETSSSSPLTGSSGSSTSSSTSYRSARTTSGESSPKVTREESICMYKIMTQDSATASAG